MILCHVLLFISCPPKVLHSCLDLAAGMAVYKKSWDIYRSNQITEKKLKLLAKIIKIHYSITETII